MKKIIYSISLLSLMVFFFAAANIRQHTPEDLGWQLAYQSYTFKNFTFEEGLKKASDIGLKYVEAYSKQPVSADNPDLTHFTADESTRNEMRQLLNKYDIKLVNYGVVKLIQKRNGRKYSNLQRKWECRHSQQNHPLPSLIISKSYAMNMKSILPFIITLSHLSIGPPTVCLSIFPEDLLG